MYSKELDVYEKLIYAEVSGLLGEEGFCWASNEYIADKLNISVRKVSSALTNLEKLGFLVRFISKEEGNKRKIYLNANKKSHPQEGSKDSKDNIDFTDYNINNEKGQEVVEEPKPKQESSVKSSATTDNVLSVTPSENNYQPALNICAEPGHINDSVDIGEEYEIFVSLFGKNKHGIRTQNMYFNVTRTVDVGTLYNKAREYMEQCKAHNIKGQFIEEPFNWLHRKGWTGNYPIQTEQESKLNPFLLATNKILEEEAK